MKNKKIVIIFIILFLIVVIGGYFGIQYAKRDKETIVEEYTPQEEISEEQFRQTIVSLYFKAKESNELSPEARLVDIKEILNDPCDKLIELLIEGPKSEKQERIIPEKTKLLKTYMESDCAVIDLSSEFLNYDKTEKNTKEMMLQSIVKTLTQLTEVNKVKILIDGKENNEFSETYVVKE